MNESSLSVEDHSAAIWAVENAGRSFQDLGMFSGNESPNPPQTLTRIPPNATPDVVNSINASNRAFIENAFRGNPSQDTLRTLLIGFIDSWQWQQDVLEEEGDLDRFIRREHSRCTCEWCAKPFTIARSNSTVGEDRAIDEAIDHFRSHINHRPYVCGVAHCSSCGNDRQRFSSSAERQSHEEQSRIGLLQRIFCCPLSFLRGVLPCC